MSLSQLRATERWLAWVRVAGVPFAIFQVAIGAHYPPGYQNWAWLVTGLFALGTAILLLVSRREFSHRTHSQIWRDALSQDIRLLDSPTRVSATDTVL